MNPRMEINSLQQKMKETNMKKEFIQSDLRNILIAACLLLGLVIFGYFLINSTQVQMKKEVNRCNIYFRINYIYC